MVFLVILGLIGLAGIGATFYAIARDGYAPARTRDAAFYRSTFDYSADHTTKETAK
ncbi:hypothetical protein [Subtercola endophyticus]|uniref:hypothetical protein n=1 Tax=Subtercola endophyticus TaxID=2895559 RepID=UPI001E5BB18A|nr:hypothetical protein [Subtercola endophyticus]UFS58446.1 hypothetical protein LQ955_15785 [Subtercola endophyticus]